VESYPFFPALILFLGAFTQSMTGFGSALVAMAVLPSLLGLPVAAPLVAATGLALESMLTVRYRQALRVDAIWRVLLASLLAAPLGVLIVRHVDERIALFVLGLLLTVYALYALFGLRLPELTHPFWAWLTGVLSGLFGGAYNTAGPPIVVYGNCRQWDAAQFKSNLSSFFVINSLFVVGSHYFNGSFTADNTRLVLLCLPATVLGFVLGQSMDRWLDPQRFRQIVLVLLVVLGIRLMIG
jgi:uncharacterized membrane protein YfcA